MPDRAPPSHHADRHTSGAVAKASAFMSWLCLWLAGVGLVAMSGIIVWQVFARYVLNASPSWSEQAALYILVWTVLLGAAAGVRERFHIRITAVQGAFGETTQGKAEIAAHLVTALIGVFLTVYGVQLVTALWGYAIPTLGLPRGSAFLPLPLAGICIFLFSLEHIAALLRGGSVRPVWR